MTPRVASRVVLPESLIRVASHCVRSTREALALFYSARSERSAETASAGVLRVTGYAPEFPANAREEAGIAPREQSGS